MNTKRLFSCLSLLVVLGLLLSGTGGNAVQAQASVPGDLATVVVTAQSITWMPQQKFLRLYLTVAAPDGQVFNLVFENGKAPTLGLKDPDGKLMADGLYRYELVAMPKLDAETLALLAKTTQETRGQVTEDLRQAGKLPSQPLTQSGTFYIEDSAYLMTAVEESVTAELEGVQPSGIIAPLDVIHADDTIVTGSFCVGFDCLTDGTENFGFDTIKLKENNLQIFFDDTSSTAGFPANDWRIITNDSSSGGANYFSIVDSTAARSIFSLAAGAPVNSLYVDSFGNIGLNTSTPVLELHLNDGDTPGMRLEQNASSGFTAQTWDIAGNESNFFIRDVTGGSKLPFRIFPGAPTNSLTILSDGKVGLGTHSPLEQLHVAGNVRVDGYVVEFSDVNVKMGFLPVQGSDVLEKLLEMPVTTWSYKAEGAEVRHMGPTAQDFYAAFGLGADNKHIAALDSNGVALAAIQELARMSAAQEARITTLEQQNADLEQRVSELEKLVQQLVEANQ